jgi:uncharacterized protein YecE (DUF72 family)
MWEVTTADLVYVRLHGHPRTYVSEYGTSGLEPWAERAGRWSAEGRSVFVFFDNDAAGAAPRDALRFRELLGRGSPT